MTATLDLAERHRIGELAPSAPPLILLTGGEIHTPDEEEAAAVLAAVAQYLADEQAALTQALRKTQEIWQWHGSKVMLAQGVAPIRAPERPAWHNIERLRLARSGVAGVVGI